ncbi:MAG TPA: serine hydroxymethyltransferase [Dehalococcoidia bacterium]
MRLEHLKQTDPQVYDLVRAEEKYEADTVRLIPSENYASAAVMEALGTVFVNKYSEGYPGKRYYEGQRYADELENLVIDRAKALFGMDHANVQPYSGSPANLAVYYGLLQPGDTIMGLSLPHGGHLTHGWEVSATSKFWRSVQYIVDPVTHLIDYDKMRELARAERPRIIVAGATAYPRLFDFKLIGEIAKEVDAYFMADLAHIAGLVVGGAHPSPVPYCDVITATTHKTLRGPRGAMILCREDLGSAIDRAVFPALQGGPHNHTTAAIGVALKEAATPEFSEYAHQVVRNSKALAAGLKERGFDLVSGGTDNHLAVIDMTSKKVYGKKTAQALDRAGIVANYNTIPYDPRRPFNPSGVRIGTPSVTSRGMKEPEMARIAAWIDEVVANVNDEARLDAIAGDVAAFCAAFPAPGIPYD